MSATTPMPPSRYVKTHGSRCPVCGSDNLFVDGFPSHDGAAFTQDIHCGACNATWTDIYELTRYSNVFPGHILDI